MRVLVKLAGNPDAWELLFRENNLLFSADEGVMSDLTFALVTIMIVPLGNCYSYDYVWDCRGTLDPAFVFQCEGCEFDAQPGKRVFQQDLEEKYGIVIILGIF